MGHCGLVVPSVIENEVGPYGGLYKGFSPRSANAIWWLEVCVSLSLLEHG